MTKYSNKVHLVNHLQRMADKYGKRIDQVFEGALDYIIGIFSAQPRKVWGCPFNEKENNEFDDIMCEYIDILQPLVNKRGWADVWGDIFMDAMAGVTKYRGQFFTPEGICQILAMTTINESLKKQPASNANRFGERQIIDDPTCGSGRTLLAANAYLLAHNAKKPYLIGEDIDTICCKMTAVNLLVHGCFGEVVCHDTLQEPGSVRFGYIINEGLWPLPGGLPTIRYTTDPNAFYSVRMWRAKEQLTTK